VLGGLTIITVIALALMANSEVSSRSSYNVANRGSLRYEAESAVSRTLWCYLWDLKKYPADHKRLGDEASERDDADGAPWLANSQPRLLCASINSGVVVKIHDAVKGRDIDADTRPGLVIRREKYIAEMEDEQLKDNLETFTYALDDYIDRDEYYSHPDYKFESEDYEKMGIKDFPANNRMQYVQEAYWIPNVNYFMSGVSGKLIDDNFRVIPPRTWQRGPLRNRGITTFSGKKSSLYSTSSNAIEIQEQLENSLLEELNELKQGSVLWSDLSDDARLALSKYSRDESGYITIEAIAMLKDGDVIRIIKSTYDANTIFKQAGKTPKLFSCWEKINY
ncbi:MAG: hypothetical protein ACRC37_01820, partial [Lentisphaeria bacterium]